MINRLLYLTFIPLNSAPTSGSSVRPLKMKEALEGLDIEVRTFGGINNDIPLRKKTNGEIRDLLKTWKPDACYIEPPSGPLFYFGDVELIRQLHRMEIPISLFYRDAYWKYPEYSAERKLSAKDRVKRSIIKQMQMYQWHVFQKNIDLIYFPSVTMAKEFDCPKKDVLPPGGFIPKMNEKRELSNPLQFIFVGGAARNHGTFLTLEAFEKLNESKVKGKLYYICPQEQWCGLGIKKEKYIDWLEVIHVSGDERLKSYYEKTDVALLTAPRSFYRDFAVPVKLFEYISYLKPILVTDCVETARVVEENQVGWVTRDDVGSVAAQLEYLCNHHDEVSRMRDRMTQARENNLWINRAKKVIHDLNDIEHHIPKE